MVVQNAQQAVDNANRYTTCDIGMCLKYSRTWLEIGSQQPDAASAWRNALGKHAGNRIPPKGAPVFWTGGSQGYGHIALCVNPTDAKIRSTDVTYGGVVGTVLLSWFDSHWRSLTYAGWAEGFNGIWIPYLKGNQPEEDWRASGKVYVEKLVRGQHDSDSVSRLRYRLQNHAKMPDSKKPGYGADYGEKVAEAVEHWLNNIDPQEGKGGPKDGSQVNNGPANRLFGDNYEVIPE
jgi:hypothetical protein